MSLEIEHRCDKCPSVIRHAEAEECYCSGCVEEIKNVAYNEGYADAKKEFEVQPLTP